MNTTIRKSFTLIFISIMLFAVTFFGLSIKTTSASTYSESESNNSVSTSNQISINTTVSAKLSSISDVDCFKFTVPQNGYIEIDFNHDVISSSSIYWKFSLYQYDGVTYYDGCGGNWNVLGNQNFTTGKLGIASGIYYIKVFTTSHYATPTYNLKVNFTEASDWEREINNTHNNANDVQFNGRINGTISDSDDVDWYKFTAPTSTSIALEFNLSAVDTANVSWYVNLYKSDADTLVNSLSIVGNMASAKSEYFSIEQGDYYVKVDANTYSFNAYTVAVIEYHSHTGDWVSATPPTCLEGGIESRTCTICGFIESRQVDPTGHKYNSEQIVKSTIFSKEKIEYTCMYCGDYYTVEGKSKMWLLPIIGVGAILLIIGLINYLKMMKK